MKKEQTSKSTLEENAFFTFHFIQKIIKIQSHRGKMRMNAGVDVEDDEKG